MVAYGEITYQVDKIWVATLAPSGVYSTPVQVEYAQGFEFDGVSDTDEILDSGAVVEGLAVLKKIVGSFATKARQPAVFAALTNLYTNTNDGTAPSRTVRSVVTSGGNRNPYFGIITKLRAGGASTGTEANSGLLIGFPRSYLTNAPGMASEMNKFGETTFEFDAIKHPTYNSIMVSRRSETAEDSPDSAAEFATFFSGS